MRALNRIPATRIVATPAALDAASWPAGALVLRFAPDEVWVNSAADTAELAAIVPDPHAIVEPDSGFAGAWLPAGALLDFLARAAEWAPPTGRPAFAQGAAAGLPVKVWLEADRALILVPAPYAADLEERMA